MRKEKVLVKRQEGEIKKKEMETKIDLWMNGYRDEMNRTDSIVN